MKRGFTIIELLVVIAIIGLLSTIASMAVNRARESAKETKAEQAISQIRNAIEMLANDTNYWPNNQKVGLIGSGSANEVCGDGCAVSLSDSKAGIIATDGSYFDWSGPYMVEIGLDPWKNEYFFDTDYQVNNNNQPCNGGSGCATAVVVGSYGPDGIGNNQYNSDDIIKILIK